MASSGLDFFLAVIKLIALGSSKLFQLGYIFRNLYFSKLFAMSFSAPGFPRLFHGGSLLRDHPFSSLLIHRFFSFDKVHVLALVFPLIGHFPPSRFDMFLSRQDANTKEACMCAFYASLNKNVSIASKALFFFLKKKSTINWDALFDPTILGITPTNDLRTTLP